MSSSTPAWEAAGLVGFGLQPRLFPDQEPRYGQLLARYRTDVEFRALTDLVANGLGLTVVEASELGLFLAPLPESPFAFSLSDYRSERPIASSEERLLHGLVFLGIAACFYPRAEDLDEERHRRVSVVEVEGFVRSACEELRRRHGDGPAVDHKPEFEQAWRIFHARHSAKASRDGRRSQTATTTLIARAFEFLVDHGLVRLARGSEDTYLPLERFRLQVRELAAHDGYATLAEVRAQQASPTGGA